MVNFMGKLRISLVQSAVKKSWKLSPHLYDKKKTEKTETQQFFWDPSKARAHSTNENPKLNKQENFKKCSWLEQGLLWSTASRKMGFYMIIAERRQTDKKQQSRHSCPVKLFFESIG